MHDRTGPICPLDEGGRREDCAAWPACACEQKGTPPLRLRYCGSGPDTTFSEMVRTARETSLPADAMLVWVSREDLSRLVVAGIAECVA